MLSGRRRCGSESGRKTGPRALSRVLTPPRRHRPRFYSPALLLRGRLLSPQVHPEPVRVQKRRGRGAAQRRQRRPVRPGHDELTRAESPYQETGLGPGQRCGPAQGNLFFKANNNRSPPPFFIVWPDHKNLYSAQCKFILCSEKQKCFPSFYKRSLSLFL